MDGSSDNTRFSVQTGLEETERKVEIDGNSGQPKMLQRNRHASTKREVKPTPIPVELDPSRWSIPLVTARLRRMAELFTRFPNSPDLSPGRRIGDEIVLKTSMPEPILDRSRDYTPEKSTPFIPLRHTEIDLATATFRAVLAMVADNPIDRSIIWSIALKRSFGKCSEELREKHRPPIKISDEGLRLRWVEKIAPAIVELFNTIPLAILAADLERARAMLDRRMSTRKW